MPRCGETAVELFDGSAFLSPKAQPRGRKLNGAALLSLRGNNHA
jgi:hypothetical protein